MEDSVEDSVSGSDTGSVSGSGSGTGLGVYVSMPDASEFLLVLTFERTSVVFLLD